MRVKKNSNNGKTVLVSANIDNELPINYYQRDEDSYKLTVKRLV